jgi:hypothetical protein
MYWVTAILRILTTLCVPRYHTWTRLIREPFFFKNDDLAPRAKVWYISARQCCCRLQVRALFWLGNFLRLHIISQKIKSFITKNGGVTDFVAPNFKIIKSLSVTCAFIRKLFQEGWTLFCNFLAMQSLQQYSPCSNTVLAAIQSLHCLCVVGKITCHAGFPRILKKH